MAKQCTDIEDLRVVPQGQRTRRVYKSKWSYLTDGKAWKLVNGADYSNPLPHVLNAIRAFARHRRCTLVYRTTDDGVIVQLFPMEPREGDGNERTA